MNVLITGGTGWVGQWMQKTRNGFNMNVFVMGQMAYNAVAWEDSDWTHIIHLAPVSPERVLDYAKSHGARVLFASSGAVYGLPGYEEYSANKTIWENECLTSGVDCVIARLFSFVAPPKHALYEFMHSNPIIVRNPGSIRTYLSGEDLGRWMWKLLKDGEGTYDVGGSKDYTMLEVAQTVSQITGAPVTTYGGEKPTRYVPNIKRALALGCQETLSLREAIERELNGRTV
jgi:nucleoside-diphosphate-sugar epimerase